MNRSEAIEMLTQSKPVLATRYGVTRLALFGSTARDAARSDSDIDILVAFDGPATSERYFGVQFYLEDPLSEQILRGHFKGKDVIRVGAKDDQLFFDAGNSDDEQTPSEPAQTRATDAT